MTPHVDITPVLTDEDYDILRVLFVEYANSLGFSLRFQNFDSELDELKSVYGGARSAAFLGWLEGKRVGCVGVKQFNQDSCEMKRLFIRPEGRGVGLGKMLARTAIRKAKDFGYKVMYLDTMNFMTEANALYKSLGFELTKPYYHNPLKGVNYYRLELSSDSR